ncbi:MAG: (2Fe-2S)-binding protein [Rhodospirillales bacterium]|jgi:isoquinoline 1-oxidoreductase alpha subunit|nr:(2Fe-2S)-binding protein [Rhodospirillaceae bacterium]MDP6427118.1 (2Fe-2S)-binding protein [Rhodospirillales bacterium]MDP6645717.1 (2Fe-2S)-binding protein [Rhodospirillales bacterium]MDP6840979.1 (2Fe-2S)-binding protein [Rhodospirillales bacterium]|tara:strand:- start:205 stop:669 length:465 start_codon:yes stop_codon:yes gene_type:complete
MILLNGTEVEVPSPLKEVRLVDFLRDHLGLTGTKFGCGIGQCGACTVHLNGRAERSCQISAGEAEGARVTTIEGLGPSAADSLHPLQKAWIAESVPQCGYCQPGQIMTAAALLKENPKPSDAEIRDAMNGNLCRCGTYGRIRKAIRRVSEGAPK